MLIAAFGLSILFVLIGMTGMNKSSSFDSIAWMIVFVWPGCAGFLLALASFLVKWIPVVKVISPTLMWLSFAATLSMLLYGLGKLLIDMVMGK